MKKKIVFTAGGTGGHIFPALAVARLCLDEYDVLWIGSKSGIESTIIPKENIRYKSVNMLALRQKGLLRKLFMPFMLLRAFFQIIFILLKEQPDIIVGFGGYVTFPVCFIAKFLGIKVIIHEQNAIPGLTNKILAKIATRILVGFEGVFPGSKTTVVGNPVREDIANIPEVQNRYLNRVGGLTIGVIGGSLGAKVFNENLPLIFSKLEQVNPAKVLRIIHQVGRSDKNEIMLQYQKYNVKNVEVVNFIDDMARLYSEVDVLICRAGASTVSEVCVASVAAIFVPYPHAVDNHQYFNAQPLVDKNVAFRVLQPEFSVDNMVELLNKLDRDSCFLMAKKVKELAINNSKELIKQIIISEII